MQNPSLLVDALSTNPVFLRNKQSDNNLVVDYKDWQIPLGRRFRSFFQSPFLYHLLFTLSLTNKENYVVCHSKSNSYGTALL